MGQESLIGWDRRRQFDGTGEVVVGGLGCHWLFLPSPETASVGELSTYSIVGIFLKVLQTGVFLNFAEKESNCSHNSNYFSQIW